VNIYEFGTTSKQMMFVVTRVSANRNEDDEEQGENVLAIKNS